MPATGQAIFLSRSYLPVQAYLPKYTASTAQPVRPSQYGPASTGPNTLTIPTATGLRHTLALAVLLPH